MSHSVRATHVCVVIDNIGDYHAARLSFLAGELARRGVRFTVIDRFDRSRFYVHGQNRAARLMAHVARRRIGEGGTSRLPFALWKLLRGLRPSHIFTIGYSDVLSVSALAYAKAAGAKAFFMADSKADDQPRRRAGELAKGRVLRLFDGALVAGQRHRTYFQSLGMSRPIEIGYDVVDNDFFAERAHRLSRRAGLLHRLALPERYVLCVSRLVGRKRLDLVLEAFARSGVAADGYRLVVVGSGPGEPEFVAKVAELGLTEQVCHLRGVRNAMMPAIYACASALILASDYDQWGLCVNEAMAVGVPCIVTDRCGVAGEIVLDGENGFVVPSGGSEPIAARLAQLLGDDVLRENMATASRATMRDWNLSRFAGAVLELAGLTEATPSAG